MQFSRDQLSASKKPSFSNQKSVFSPFLTSPLKIQGTLSFPNGSAFYNEKYNMIITNPDDNTIQFYDATTLLPLEERKPKQISSLIADYSYDNKTDTFLLSTESGSIYSYNVCNDMLKKLKDCEEYIIAVEFVSSDYYVFVSIEEKELYLGNTSNKIFTIRSKYRDIYNLYRLPKNKLLLASFDDGTVMMYRTDRLPEMPVFGSISAHKVSFSVVRMESGSLNGKEIVITATKDLTIKIWKVARGTMKLLRVIYTKEKISGFVYLEKERMVAAICGLRAIKFWSVVSGKLERTFEMDENKRHVLFLMKDKGIIGAARCKSNLVEFVQLYRCEERDE